MPKYSPEFQKIKQEKAYSTTEEPEGLKSELKRKWEGKEVLDPAASPLEDMTSEDDQAVFGKDPKKEWTELGDFPESASFENKIERDNYVEPFDKYKDHADPELSFEDKDVLSEIVKERNKKKESALKKWMVGAKQRFLDKVFARKQQERLEKQARDLQLPYSAEEFVFMEKAAQFKNALANNPELKATRPLFSDGRELTNSQIKQQVKQWQDSKGQRNRFSLVENNLMRNCQEWYKLYESVYKKQLPVVSADGIELTKEQINELATEFDELKKDPVLFERMNFEVDGRAKVEKGYWREGKFTWTAQAFNGKPQWYYKKDGNYFISEKDPSAIAKPGTTGMFFYTVKSELIDKNDPKAKKVWVDIKLPKNQELPVQEKLDNAHIEQPSEYKKAA